MEHKLQQGELFPKTAAERDTVVVNDRVTLRTEEGHRVVSLGALVFHYYRLGDRMAESYAMVMLVESGHADQKDVARAFGRSIRSLRRDQERLASGGLQALGRGRGRPAGSRAKKRVDRLRDQTILRLKNDGLSNRAIGCTLGLDEKAVRKRLKRLGWKPPGKQLSLFEETPAASSATPADGSPGTLQIFEEKAADEAGGAGTSEASDSVEEEELPWSSDPNPLDRSFDRFFAAIGLLEDAAPLFAKASAVPNAGVLLAIPALRASGLLSIAKEVYGSIGPAFYGLRTTLVAFVLFALLRIKRPEALKEHQPVDLGRIVGLDRAPEVKTLRRKLTRLAALGGAEQLGRELARRRVEEHGEALGFLYLDGHVRVYHGKRPIPKAHVARMRLSLPATTDYWVNDERGDPLFVVTAQANASMVKMLPVVLKEVRALLGPERRVTIVFDRGGWSPQLFAKLLAENFDIMTYRKGRVRRIAEKRFKLRKATFDGRPVEYFLNDQPVRLLRGKLRLRQVTRLSPDGHQTPILTSRWDLPDIRVAYRMFGRWRQENFFKYLREEFLIDALVDYKVEPDDPTRSVPNPAWRQADRELKAAQAELAKLERAYGAAAIENKEGERPTMRGFKIAHGKLGNEIRTAREHVKKLRAKRAALQRRQLIGEVLQGQEVVRLSKERKHLTNLLKMVAYQIESDLLALLRPHYARTEDEGRTLIQTAFRSAATIDPTESGELRVKLLPLSSPHRSRAVTALCEVLNRTGTRFPGTRLVLRYSVAEAPP
jgi:prepilin-type processing-associated H-X9-DG protein